MKYDTYSKDELKKELDSLLTEYKKYQDMNLNLDMTRGKPCKEQLDLSLPMMDVLDSKSNYSSLNDIDCRNYGVLDGIDECKKLLGDIIEVDSKNIIIFGNSSLNIMYDLISHSFTHGVLGNTPWAKLDHIKWLCVVPGYDRHFSITEHFNIEMINVPILDDGPDMDMIEKLVENDESIKGIWCVPKYSNPTGTTYSIDTVKRFARLNPKAKDFRIYWDNAYSVHHLYNESQDYLLELVNECKKAGNPDLVYKFTSTSKISFPGSGIAALAASKNNIEDIKSYLKYQTIGHDKVNELRHVRFFKDLNGIKEQMEKHANILRPKFELVETILEKELNDIISFTKPKGGYFISIEVNKIAKEVIERCKDAGLKLTEAGSCFPYHFDPNNSNIRLAPSYPSLDELEVATNLLVLAVKIETINKILNNKEKYGTRLQQ